MEIGRLDRLQQQGALAPAALDRLEELIARAAGFARRLGRGLHPAIAVRLLRAGADGFVCKDNAYATIGLALRRTHAGGRFVDPDLVDGVLALSSGQVERSVHELLSEREYEVLQLMVAGRPLKAIAGALGISPKTVSTHKSRLMEKLGVDDTTVLVQLAMRRGVGPQVGGMHLGMDEADPD